MKHIFNEVHYELTRKIAEGGMGMVYEAVQRGIGGFRKVVAIKLIREGNIQQLMNFGITLWVKLNWLPT